MNFKLIVTLLVISALLITIFLKVEHQKTQAIYKSYLIHKDLRDIFGTEKIKFNKDNVRLVVKLVNMKAGTTYDRTYSTKIYDKIYKTKYIGYRQVYQIVYYCIRDRK